jgi:hypothetical protein
MVKVEYVTDEQGWHFASVYSSKKAQVFLGKTKREKHGGGGWEPRGHELTSSADRESFSFCSFLFCRVGGPDRPRAMAAAICRIDSGARLVFAD